MYLYIFTMVSSSISGSSAPSTSSPSLFKSWKMSNCANPSGSYIRGTCVSAAPPRIPTKSSRLLPSSTGASAPLISFAVLSDMPRAASGGDQPPPFGDLAPPENHLSHTNAGAKLEEDEEVDDREVEVAADAAARRRSAPTTLRATLTVLSMAGNTHVVNGISYAGRQSYH